MRGNSSRIARAASSPLLCVCRRHPDVYEDQIRGVRAYLSALSHLIYPHARPSANMAVGRMRRGGHMSHSSGGKPPCAAA